MITLLLEDSAGGPLGSCGMAGNERIYGDLPETFPLLRGVERDDFRSFETYQTPQLLDELARLRAAHAADLAAAAHLEEAIALAELCQRETGSTLTFTSLFD